MNRQNRNRALRAKKAVDLHSESCGTLESKEEASDRIVDLFADLFHYQDHMAERGEKFDIKEILKRAENHYRSELNEE